MSGLLEWTEGALFLGTSLLLAGSASADVRIADSGGGPSFATLQAAVDAASDGDVLLVGAGVYGSFAVDGKGVWIVADPHGPVRVDGSVAVTDLPQGREVVLVGIEVEALPLSGLGQSFPGLFLVNNAGAVRIENCSFTGAVGQGDGTCEPAGEIHGGHGALVLNSAEVACVGSTFTGGHGAGSPGTFFCLDAVGGDGADGMNVTGADVALYDCELVGGAGGEAGVWAGDAGDGYEAVSGTLFASGSTFRGGFGGHAWDWVSAYSGDGGDGLVVLATSVARLLDNDYIGGPPGLTLDSPGRAGVGISGPGTTVTYPGFARSFTAGTLGADDGDLVVNVVGQPGDRVFLAASHAPGFLLRPALRGVWLLPYPVPVLAAGFGTIPGSGVLQLQVQLPGVPPGEVLRRMFVQGLVVDGQGQTFLGSPMHVVVLSRDSTPDCDANLSLDYLDVIELSAADCNENFNPDACDAAALDCNGNGVPDSCDIAEGTSTDIDGNGVPDECEVTDKTWYVDAAAPPGGDGSHAAPFRTLREGIDASFTGDTVLVKDGTYVGADNRDLEFFGRDIVVRSENGPAACVIDPMDLGRAFHFRSTETRAARVEGFTITRARSFSRGGAIEIEGGSSPTIARCVFQQNYAEGSGGAVSVHESEPLIEHCTFLNNGSNSRGGGVSVRSESVVVVSHCRFFENYAFFSGGAIHSEMRDPDPAGPGRLVIDHCLIAGNFAEFQGAGIQCGVVSTGFHNRVRVTNSTIVDNTCFASSGLGGGIGVTHDAELSVSNTLLWDNSAASGAQLAVYPSAGGLPQVTVSYSDVLGGQPAVFFTGGSLTFGAGNVDADPLFVDPDGADGIASTTADNDYRLGAGSACVDAGDNLSVSADLADVDGDGVVSEFVPLDLDGNARFVDDPAVADTGNGTPPLVDMGAYERQP